MNINRKVKRLKVRTFIYHHLQGNQKQQRVIMQSGVLTSISSSKRSAISGPQCLNEWTLDPQSEARQTHLCPSQPLMAFTPQCSPAMTDNV